MDKILGITNLSRRSKSLCACILLSALSASGCSLLVPKEMPDYRTVEASPHRDTVKAEKEHEAALEILDCCEHPWTCPLDCGCIRGKLCSIHKAEQHLQNALIADVRYGPAHNTLGLLYFSQQKLYLAAWEFDYAMRLMKGRSEPLNNMGLVFEAAGQNERAVEMYEQALALAPDNPEYLGNSARAQLKMGAPIDDVRHLLERTVVVDPRPQWKAWASEQLGLHPSRSHLEIRAFGEQSLELDPGPVEEIPPGESAPPLLLELPLAPITET